MLLVHSKARVPVEVTAALVVAPVGVVPVEAGDVVPAEAVDVMAGDIVPPEAVDVVPAEPGDVVDVVAVVVVDVVVVVGLVKDSFQAHFLGRKLTSPRISPQHHSHFYLPLALISP